FENRERGRFNSDAIPLSGGKRRTSVERGRETPPNGYEVLSGEHCCVVSWSELLEHEETCATKSYRMERCPNYQACSEWTALPGALTVPSRAFQLGEILERNRCCCCSFFMFQT
ncbi:hypothetical protein ATANTOWER_007335, partial [Ataeniobius toweri]|nr:hypothetical protein [Ataeniobius toweri]